MAKLGLSIGIDADVTGLRKMGQQVTGELEKLRGATNRIGSSINAAMALPLVSFVGNIMEAHAQARKIRDELVFPFSHKMHEAQISADMRKMQLGQRMVAAGMDEPGARSITAKAEEEMMLALMAQGPTTMVGRSLTSAVTEPGKFMANIVRAVEGNIQAQSANLGALLSGDFAGAFGFGEMSDANAAQRSLGEARNAAALSMATGDIGSFESNRLQLERQTYILQEIERNTQGKR